MDGWMEKKEASHLRTVDRNTLEHEQSREKETVHVFEEMMKNLPEKGQQSSPR
jgi:hypothetical protein